MTTQSHTITIRPLNTVEQATVLLAGIAAVAGAIAGLQYRRARSYSPVEIETAVARRIAGMSMLTEDEGHESGGLVLRCESPPDRRRPYFWWACATGCATDQAARQLGFQQVHSAEGWARTRKAGHEAIHQAYAAMPECQDTAARRTA